VNPVFLHLLKIRKPPFLLLQEEGLYQETFNQLIVLVVQEVVVAIVPN
jgi:hypothetical protein